MHISQISTTSVENVQGIYKIVNIKTGRIYIGQTKHLYKRWISHKSALLNGKHANSYLQNSWNKHGEDAFEFLLVELCSTDVVTEREKYHISTVELTYNMKNAADHPNGAKAHVPSAEQRKKQSDALKGRRPKNLDSLHKAERKPLAYYVNGVLIKMFDSAREGAQYFNMKPNMLHQYIGITRKTKKFPIGYKLEYV